MAVDTTLLRIPRTNFFSIMIPGAYLLGGVFLVSLMIHDNGEALSLWAATKPIVEALTTYWPLSIAVLFVIYLVGTVLYAIPVRYADVFCGYVFTGFVRNKWLKIVYATEFPYEAMQGEIVDTIRKYKPIPSDLVEAEGLASPTLFNYRKLLLSSDAPQTFIYLQSLEARVRLFAGMFWAAVVGGISGIVMYTSCLGNPELRAVWYSVAIGLVLLSAITLITFGMNLRRVRGLEVEILLIAYCTMAKGPLVEAPRNPRRRPRRAANPR